VVNAAARGVVDGVAFLPSFAIGGFDSFASAAVVVVHGASALKKATCGPS
jgi:hypothetical protein